MNIHFGILVDGLGVIIFSVVTAYLLYVRRKRESIVREHPPRTPKHTMYTRLLQPSSLIISTLFLIFFSLSLVLSSFSSGRQQTQHSGLSPLYILLAVIIILIFLANLFKYRKK
jgi:hypothetical protein